VEITLSLRSVLTPQGILPLPLGFEEHAAARFFLQGTFADKRVLVFLQPGGVLGTVGQRAATGDSDSAPVGSWVRLRWETDIAPIK
jgi:hypothetical protein